MSKIQPTEQKEKLEEEKIEIKEEQNQEPEKKKRYISKCKYMREKTQEEIFEYYNTLNEDKTHMASTDDICTSMECVRTMIDYIPEELWQRDNIRVLDPCAGNGNFGAYCMFKTDINNIYFNELSDIRYKNCRKILKPSHIQNKDYLEFKSGRNANWDLIMANPPYSGGGNKNQSLSNVFIEHSIDLLNDRGYLCFITPNNWMSYNNNNTTLRKLLEEGSFVVIDNDAKKFFPKVGSSFTIFVWQKGVHDNSTLIVNNFLVKDIQRDVRIPRNLPFIPLYISQNVLNMIPKMLSTERNRFNYRCDLHNFTQKDSLSDIQDETFRYKTIHTIKKVRYANKKQDIYGKWLIIVPLSTYYIPLIMKDVNVTQSVGYIECDTKKNAERYIKKITKPHFKLLIHLTRYGNFNNIMVLKHLKFDDDIQFTPEEKAEISRLTKHIKY